MPFKIMWEHTIKCQQQQPPIVFQDITSFEYKQILEYIRKFSSLFTISTV